MPLKKRVNQYLETIACITPSSPICVVQKSKECLFLFLFSLQNHTQTKYTFSNRECFPWKSRFGCIDQWKSESYAGKHANGSVAHGYEV